MEKATVIELTGDKALVEPSECDACISCAARHACLNLGGKSKRILINNTLSAQPGDVIEFLIDERGVVFSAIIAYLMPLLLMIAGILAGSRFHGRMGVDIDAGAAIGGIIGLGGAVLFLKLITPIIKKRVIFTPRMTGIHPMRKSH